MRAEALQAPMGVPRVVEWMDVGDHCPGVGYPLPRRLTRSVERGTHASDPELELADALAE
ncbi:MAG: hypothetical protein ACLP8S_04530 [Solirubrobacteraceae bacterium]